MNRLIQSVQDIFRSKSAIERELASLREQLENIDSLHVMCQSDGWIKLRHAMVGRIAMLETDIVKLCDDVAKNAEIITAKKSLREAMIGLISEIETTLSYDSEIRKRIGQLSEITRLAGLREADTQV